MNNSREAALKILYSIEFDGAYSNLALKEGLKNSGLTQQDKGFVTQIVYGTASMKRALDAVIGKYSSVKLKKLSKYVLIILRMGIYQLFYMDRVPDSAAVNESVKLVSVFAPRSKGFVNAVLRSVQRGGAEYKTIAEELSFPDWMYELWTGELGKKKAVDLMRSLNTAPAMSVRANTLRCTTQELIKLLEEAGVNAQAYKCGINVSGLDAGSSELFLKGYFTVQDIAAQLAAVSLAPTPGSKVLDICAAPGGKTTHIAELMQNRGEITAFDIYEHKIRLIEQNAQRLGISIIKAAVHDASVFDPALSDSFDYVLADVPCSGLGIIRRKPDIKWNAAPDAELYEIQKKILDNAAAYLKPGGEMVYSTCTINKRENEYRIDEFLKEHRSFEVSDDNKASFYPDTDGTDGFFICKLRRRKNND